MKRLLSDSMRRTVAVASGGLASLLAASCALPPQHAWHQIRERGLIPVLIDARQTEIASNNTGAYAQDAVRVQAVKTPAVVKTTYASAVPGRPGYVFSPFTQQRAVVDVRGYRRGEEVRCPYTSQIFLVPNMTAVAAASRPAPVRRHPRSVAQVVSNDPELKVLDEALTKLEPEPEPASGPETTPAPAPETTGGKPPINNNNSSTATAPVKPAIPYGSRVAGRPGFVYSPFASKTQLVDVAGTAPGVVVKCPYTNKLFRVPESNVEEIKPETFPPSAPSETAETPAAPEPPVPVPAPPADLAPSQPEADAGLGNPQPR